MALDQLIITSMRGLTKEEVKAIQDVIDKKWPTEMRKPIILPVGGLEIKVFSGL